MIFDRISLVKSYAGLKVVELNDGKVKDILFNKTAYYGTKTVRRFTLQYQSQNPFTSFSSTSIISPILVIAGASKL